MDTLIAFLIALLIIYLRIAIILWRRNKNSGDFFESLFWITMLFDDNDFDLFD